MQPQEAINCNRDQLGPQQVSMAQPALVPAQHHEVWTKFFGPLRKQQGSFHLLSNLYQGFYWQPIKSFIALPLSSPPVLVIRGHNYSPLKKSCFYRRRLISQWPLPPHPYPPVSISYCPNPDGQNQSQSQVHTNCFPHLQRQASSILRTSVTLQSVSGRHTSTVLQRVTPQRNWHYMDIYIP